MSVVLTMGDPAGVSAEITLKTWLAQKKYPFAVIDDPDRLKRCAKELNLPVPITPITKLLHAPKIFPQACPVLPLGHTVHAIPGRPDPALAPLILASLQKALALTLSKEADALVTNPVSKSVLAADFPYPGHTEYLHAKAGASTRPLMLMCSKDLKVALVTVHIPLAQVASTLNQKDIEQSGFLLHTSLKKFGILQPRIKVAALNPHGGDDGLLGDEEARIIAPAVEQMKARGLDVSGPYPADTLFYAAAQNTYDAVLCMYHDQALIPFKTLKFPGGTNITLGLNIVRVSPDHGPAFNIAGKGVADHRGLLEALRWAHVLTHG